MRRILTLFRSLLRRILTPRFLKFGMVGSSGILVNQGVLYLAQKYIFHITHVETGGDWLSLNLSLAMAIFFATVNNFIWNRAWTWADRKQHDKHILAQFGQYVMACWLSIVLQMLLTNLLARYFSIFLANLISIGLTSALNFLLNDTWAFGRRTARQDCINEP